MKFRKYCYLIFVLINAAEGSDKLNVSQDKCIESKWQNLPVIVCNRSNQKLFELRQSRKDKYQDYEDKYILSGLEFMSEKYGNGIASKLISNNFKKNRLSDNYISMLLIDSKGCKVLYNPGKKFLKSMCTKERYDLAGRVLRSKKNELSWNLLMVPSLRDDSDMTASEDKDDIDFYPRYYFSRFTFKNKLLTALNWGYLEFIKSNINKKSINKIIDKNGNTALLLALNGNGENLIETVDYLIGLGADLNAANSYGSLPLFFAMLKGNLKIVRLLINKGAKICLMKSKSSDIDLLLENSVNGIKILLLKELDKC